MSKVGTTGATEVAPIQDSSLLAFYRDMNLPERRTFWACAAGWALDGMDFMIYPLVIGTIIALWKVDPGTAGLAGTVTLLASAIGGWLGGYLADRIGRVKTLQLTILWFSVFSLLCAFVQNFDQLLIARALLGLGFGGEWAAGAVLMGEIDPRAISRTRGRIGAVRLGGRLGPRRACRRRSCSPGCRRRPPGDGCSPSARCRHCWCFFCGGTSRSPRLPPPRWQNRMRAVSGRELRKFSPVRFSRPLFWRRWR